MDRDGIMPGQLGQPFGFGFASSRALARALGERGIATFRYDKRGSPASGLDPGTTVELARDATAALAVLLRDPRLDPGSVFVIGHSQGGQMVPWLFQNEPQIAGGVLLAAPARPVSEVIRRQGAALPKLLEQRGASTFEAHRQGMLVVAAAERIAGLSVDDLSGSTLGVENHIWHSWMLMSLAAPWLAKRAQRPLLVVWGTADTNVDREDFETWQQALSGRGSAHRFVAIEGMTHALNGSQPGSPDRVSTALAHGLSEEVARFIEESRRDASTLVGKRQRPSTHDSPASR
jgi:pimeloyl-ACP methyl ester carboxylesterase